MGVIDEARRMRNEALISLNESKIRAYGDKYGEKFPHGIAFWMAVHKARVECTDMPHSVREFSREWLHNVKGALNRGKT